MNIEIDGIPLVRTEQNKSGAVVEVSNISNINTTDKRNVIEHEIPGMEGNVFQNLGRSAVRISFDGTFQGKTAKNKIELIRSKFKQGTPLPFNSDVSGATDVTKVMIEDLKVNEVAGLANRFEYSILLREYKEPPPEPTTPPSQDGQAEEWADEVASETMDSINYITGKVLDSEGNPKSGVSVLVTGDEGEHKLETDGEGIYRVDDLPPGNYKVKVDLEEYEGIEKEMTIGGGEGGETGATEATESGVEESTSQTESGTESSEEEEQLAGGETATEEVTSSDEEATQEQKQDDEEKTPEDELAEKPTAQTESATESSQVEGDEQPAGGETATEEVTSSDEEANQEQRQNDETKTPGDELAEKPTAQTESDSESSQVEGDEQPAGGETATKEVTSSDEEKTPGDELAEKPTAQTESDSESSQVEEDKQTAGEEKPTKEVTSSNEEATQEQRQDDEKKRPKEKGKKSGFWKKGKK